MERKLLPLIVRVAYGKKYSLPLEKERPAGGIKA
jgi:hypothetical protein